MKITFLGAAECVTGSCYLVQTESGSLLIDCGMFQGSKELILKNNNNFAFEPSKIDAVILTHSHIDHSGLLPKLIKSGFENKIYLTTATAEMTEILLYDSQRIQKSEAEWKNKKMIRQGQKAALPLYDENDVKKTVSLFKNTEYHEPFDPVKNIKAVFKDAGHIMGSAYLELQITENGITKKIIFSGDIGRSDQAIIKDPEVSEKADILVLESTYGNRLHKIESDTNNELLQILEEVYKTKGILIIPAFAVGRTQEMIYRFFELMEKNELPLFSIFVDSPMAIKITKIYEEHKDLYDNKSLEYIKNGKNPLYLPNIAFLEKTEDSMKLNSMKGPFVIISASGMCDNGRITHHLKHHLWKRNTHILFVGYQGEGTIGRKIVDGAKKIKIHGEMIEVNAKVHTVGGLSAHADQRELTAWLSFYKKSNPIVMLTHGEAEVCRDFSNHINKTLNLKTFIPEISDSADIIFKENNLDVTLNKNGIIDGTNNERVRFRNNILKIDTRLESDTSKNSHDASKAVIEMLKRINDAIDEVLNEYPD